MMKKDAEPVAAAAPAEVAAANVAEPPVVDPDTAPPEPAPDSAAPPEEFVDVFAETDEETPAGDVAAEPGSVAAEIASAPVESASADAAPAAAPVKASSGKTFRDCESCPLMVSLPGGTFKMGSPSSEPGRNAYEGPQRDVTVKPFAIGVYEITSAEWAACVAEGACSKKRADETGKLPALGVSWRDATAYASWLSKKTGGKYRLPSESEWEYAARAGSTTAYWWGDKFDRARVSAREASAVGSYEANAFGLYDVLGNAREWVADCYVNNFVKAPTDGAAVADGDCSKRVIRGGAWSNAPVDMRTANRSRIDSGVTVQYMGVRLAAELK
jgi:formylglycine-generating enzyme required for sulfatase activity